MTEIIIKKIEIQNFRSIKKMSLDFKKVALLVGKNDAGKSNILRAINLFFNNETDVGRQFNFSKDFHKDAHHEKKAKKADEIIITLTLHLPRSYQKTNGHILVWKKSWRKDTKTPKEEYHGIKQEKDPRGKNIETTVVITAKANLRETLNRINFIYVPAIKNADYFDFLRGEIYSTIAKTADKSFKKSSQSFESSIGNHVTGLMNELSQALGYTSTLSLPEDLTSIFEKLDFINDQNISLNQRGDGIKTRHIPHILKFMASQQKTLNKKGASRFTTIWGYEEPENNLEVFSCMELAQELFSCTEKDIAQIILTTHSPVFYNYHDDNQETSSLHYIYKQGNETFAKTSNSIDDDMGNTALYAKALKPLQDEIKKLAEQKQQNQKAFEQLQNLSKIPRIFVEGKSDKLIIQKALKVFAGITNNQIIVETKHPSGGYNYVIDMLNSWRSKHKHNTLDAKAVGILDMDSKSHCNEFNKISDNINSCKVFLLPTPEYLTNIDKSNFKFSCCLESVYSENVWKYAKDQNWLEVKNPTDYLLKKHIETTQNTSQTLQDIVNELNPPLSITHKFKVPQKIIMAQWLSNKSDADFRKDFDCLETLLDNILSFLKIPKNIDNFLVKDSNAQKNLQLEES